MNAVHSINYWLFAVTRKDRDGSANSLLEHLTEDGLAVVELPEPDPQGCFSAGGGTRVMVTSDGKITNGYAIRENAEEARALAAALLAAAAQLEAQS